MPATRFTPFIVILLATACGGPQVAKERPHPPLSSAEHYTEARRHDQVASGHEVALKRNRESMDPSGVECFDQRMAPPLTSGGERIPLIQPCWTRETDMANVAHRQAAARHRKLAAAHRARAQALIDAERRACAGLGEREISHTPFWHREDITAVTPVVKGNRLVGATTVFKKVRGLSVQWMTRAVACHQARAAAMGYRTTFHAYCPLTLPYTQASVYETPAGIVVTVTSPQSDIASIALARARQGEQAGQ